MVGDQRNPIMSEEPVKNLGRWFDESLKDINHKIDRCLLQGKFKVWCLQHIFIPMLLWSLLVYEIVTSTVE